MNRQIEGYRGAGIHFRKTAAAAFMLFIICVSALWIALGRYDSKTEADYLKLMRNEEGLENSAYTSRQWREGAQKDVFFYENGRRLQLRVNSERSQLALDRRDDQTDIVEHMHNAVCYIQEELFYKLADGREAILEENGRLLIRRADPNDANSWINKEDVAVRPMQFIRLIEAGSAFYYYKNSQFIAEEVKVAHYEAPGHTIDQAGKLERPLMDGTASWAEFSMAGKDMNFKAYQLKAKFYGSEKGL